MEWWILLFLLPHDNNTISFRCFVLNSGREICTSLVDCTLGEVLAGKAVDPELSDNADKLVPKWCWKVVLKIIGETNWLFVKEARESRQSRILQDGCLSQSKCRQRGRHKVSAW